MHVGFYGKLPSHGDFVRRRVSDAFVDAWDTWLRECLAASRTTLGARWLDVYLTSPAWRFACAAGACGPAPVVGLLAPSVDQAGRYFPITLACELPAQVNLVTAAVSPGFFDSAERLVLDTLAAEQVDFDRFDRGVAALAQELVAVLSPPGLALDDSAAAVLGDTPQAWQLPLSASSAMGYSFEQLLSLHLEARYRPLVMWWTDGSVAVEPSCLVLKGLPGPALYPALLEGSWSAHAWRSVPARGSDVLALPTSGAGHAETLYFRSAAATDVGRVREHNEDGFVERPECGIWAVADGMGGHSHGEVASRMVCDALADFPLDGTFEETIEAATRRVQEVNDHLVRTAATADPIDRSGSTVAVLLLRGLRSAVMWAGDSRVYRWRAGKLEQLTRDHSLAELAGTGAAESSMITNAVGVEPELRLEICRDGIVADDRFLLCSDGLTRVVPDPVICGWMGTPDIRAAVDGLIKTTLDAGAPDNVTVLIAEVYR